MDKLIEAVTRFVSALDSVPLDFSSDVDTGSPSVSREWVGGHLVRVIHTTHGSAALFTVGTSDDIPKVRSILTELFGEPKATTGVGAIWYLSERITVAQALAKVDFVCSRSDASHL